MFFIIKKIKYVFYLIFNPLVVSNKIIKDIRKDFFSRNFNSDHKFVWCAGLPKSGTTMIEDILDELPYVKFDSSLLRNFDNRNLNHPHGISNEMFLNIPKKKYTYLKTHTHYSDFYEKIANENNAKIIISIRDIRDMLISRYYHLKNDKNHPMSQIISNLNFEEGFFKSITLPIKDNNKDALSFYSEWIFKWLEVAEKKKYLVLRYEDYVKDEEKYINKILIYLELQNQFDKKKINNVLQKNRKKFTNFEKNINKKGFFQKTFRSGKIGEWKFLFTDKINDHIDKKLNSNYKNKIFYNL
tara:strand:- start:587 stop:1483 length:897 start_codon:yes stop_codon:yes gene_type:complete